MLKKIDLEKEKKLQLVMEHKAWTRSQRGCTAKRTRYAANATAARRGGLVRTEKKTIAATKNNAEKQLRARRGGSGEVSKQSESRRQCKQCKANYDKSRRRQNRKTLCKKSTQMENDKEQDEIKLRRVVKTNWQDECEIKL